MSPKARLRARARKKARKALKKKGGFLRKKVCRFCSDQKLTIDYREKYYGAGKIPGGFMKREGPPSPKEILTMRMTDRPIRPLFPKGFKREVQVVCTLLASDREHPADALATTIARMMTIPNVLRTHLKRFFATHDRSRDGYSLESLYRSDNGVR